MSKHERGTWMEQFILRLKHHLHFHKERFKRLGRDLKEAWRSFRYDVVMPPNDWIAEYAERLADKQKDKMTVMQWTNFPTDRGFGVVKNNGRWEASDDNGNMYWLNVSSKRWICMSGPDSDLPADEYGNVNHGQNFTHDGQGYLDFHYSTGTKLRVSDDLAEHTKSCVDRINTNYRNEKDEDLYEDGDGNFTIPGGDDPHFLPAQHGSKIEAAMKADILAHMIAQREYVEEKSEFEYDEDLLETINKQLKDEDDKNAV